MKSVEKEEVIDAKKMTNKMHVDVMRSKLKKLGEVETPLISNVALVSKSSKDDVKRRGAKKMSLQDMRAKLSKAAEEGKNQTRMEMLREGIKENVEKRRDSVEAAIKKSEIVRKEARERSEALNLGRKRKNMKKIEVEMTKVEEVKQASEILQKTGESLQDNEATFSETMAEKDKVILSEHSSEIQGPLALNLSPPNVFFDHSKTVTKPSKEVTNE